MSDSDSDSGHRGKSQKRKTRTPNSSTSLESNPQKIPAEESSSESDPDTSNSANRRPHRPSHSSEHKALSSDEEVSVSGCEGLSQRRPKRRGHHKAKGNTSDPHSETHQRLAPVVKSPVERRQDHMMPSCSSEEAAISSSNTMQYRPAEHLEALSSPPGPSSSGTNGSRNEMVHHNTRTPTESEGNSSDSESENHHSLPSALKRQMSSCSSPAPASSSSNSMPQPGAEHSEALTSQPGPSSTSGNNRSGNVIEQHNARPATESEASVNRNQQGSSSPNSVPPPQHLPEDVAEGGGATARERFNNRNQQVTPLRKCSELVPGRRYKIMNLSRTNTQYGPAIRALIEDDRSPTGRSFIYLPVRFRSMSDEDITELNSQANSSDGLFIVYNGRVGRADMVELV
ncbi:E3 ubiquitin-protein ligase pub3 [Frankliniella fusca]|uniref:E3 ubiquitin-protein ligase pub3 n=1 Tax=Frankliniella fusca TaxID=407009 RepID=A0AAE1GRT8_9NEOP|nr:E3 ubiquitin-protein ligase pub3 [Frankliniella fusca]